MNAVEIARALNGRELSTGGWSAKCPAHDDSSPSLSISEGVKGPLVCCHAGCEQTAVIDALRDRGLWQERDDSIPLAHVQLGRYSRHWDYHDAAGAQVLRVCRWDLNGKKEIRPLSFQGGTWTWKQLAHDRPLYCLPALQTDMNRRVLMVEGEKTADAAQKYFPDLIVTTWAGGAKAANKTDWQPLAGRDVTLVPDHDEPGRKAMDSVASILRTLGCTVRRVDVSELGDLPEGWDIADAAGDESFDLDALWHAIEHAPIGIATSGARGALTQINGAPAAPRAAASEESTGIPERAPLDWTALANSSPPVREWVIDHWIPRNEVTLLSGPGGIGKTGVTQALASCVALQRSYLDWVPCPRRVLMWAAEDDSDELWRRQAAIARGLDVNLSEFAGKLYLESFHRTQVDLAALVQGRLTPMAMMNELRAQIGDYGAELVILDNIARLFGGNENDRHQVSSFITMLNYAASPTKAAIILLGHPAKAAGSEFSGSTAWEGAVRTRLYLGARLPDGEQDEDEAGDDGIRYLCRRKANYSSKDWRRIRYLDGVMVPDEPDQPGATAKRGDGFARDAVLAAVRKLALMNEHGNTSTASPNYLPKLAKRYDLLDSVPEKQFGKAMFELVKAGQLTSAAVGKHANRTARHGLIEVPR